METYIVIIVVILIILSLFLIHFRPSPSLSPTQEGFSMAASVDPLKMPACVSRSTDAQSLLDRISSFQNSDDANELRLLVSKICCMEADIVTPSPGTYRTYGIQFRTQQDIEPAATLVGRCLANSLPKRDIEIIIDKFSSRGHVLIQNLNLASGASTEFDGIITQLKWGLLNFCFKPQPSLDHPEGVRDMGYWEPEAVAELSQYQGVSSTPK